MPSLLISQIGSHFALWWSAAGHLGAPSGKVFYAIVFSGGVYCAVSDNIRFPGVFTLKTVSAKLDDMFAKYAEQARTLWLV
jgi:hypothetical protein